MRQKRMGLSRLLTAVSAGALLVSMSACNGGSGSKGDSSANDSEVVNGCHVTGYPIAAEPITLKVMVKDYTGLTDYADNALVQEYEKKTGIKIEWEILKTGQPEENVLLAYSSGTLPDIFLGMAPCNMSVQWPYIEQGMAKPLDDLIDKYAPNIKAAFENVPDAKYLCTAPDGKIYMLPYIDNSTIPTSYFDKALINTKWLEAVGRTMPATTGEFREVLELFKKGDPNGNGAQDEIPMKFHVAMPYCMYSPFGISNAAGAYQSEIDDKGVYSYTPGTEKYKKALKFYEGLISDGLFDTSMMGVASNAGEYLDQLNKPVETIGVIGGWEVDIFNGMNADRLWNDYQYLPPLKGPDGQYTSMLQVHESIWAEWFTVTSACKNPEAAVRWADFFYTSEGAMWAEYGPGGDGKAWTETDDGKYKLTPENLPEGYDQMKWQNSLTIGHCLPSYQNKALEEKMYKKSSSEMSTLEMVINRDVTEANKEFIKHIPKNKFPKLNYQAEDYEFMKSNAQQIYSKAETYRNDVFAGKKKVDATWDQYAKELSELGLNILTEINQDTYDAYMKWMAGNS